MKGFWKLAQGSFEIDILGAEETVPVLHAPCTLLTTLELGINDTCGVVIW